MKRRRDMRPRRTSLRTGETMRSALIAGIFALLLAFAFTASAQTDPCQTQTFFAPQFTPTFGNPVKLNIREWASSARSGTALYSITGTNIIVTQVEDDILPAAASCNDSTVTLGALAPGTYQVKWAILNGGPVETAFSYSYALVVPDPAVPVLDRRALAALLLVLTLAGVWFLRR
jgi:hypothetical protein